MPMHVQRLEASMYEKHQLKGLKGAIDWLKTTPNGSKTITVTGMRARHQPLCLQTMFGISVV